MSRYIEVDVEYKIIKESIVSMDECLHLINEVCCNENSDFLAEFVPEEYCKNCPYFMKEDGILEDEI